MAQIKDVMTRYMVPAFQAKSCNMAVTCAQIMEESLVKKFTEAGFKPEVRTVDSFQDDYGLEEPAGDDDDEEEEEEDDDDEEDGYDEGDGEEESDDEAVDTPSGSED